MTPTKRLASKEDKALAEAILNRDTCRHGPGADCSEYHYNNLVSDITSALAVARNEAQAEAFKDAFAVECVDCAEGNEPIYDAQARWYYHGQGREQVGCSASKLRLEATNESGGETRSRGNE